MMEKKLISGVVASAVAMAAMPASAAKPNAAVGLDNPLDEAFCSFNEGGFLAGWYDPNVEGGGNTGDTKYGGDIEFDAMLYYTCDFAGTEAEGAPGAEASEGSESAIVDVDLSRDESDPFSYTCEGGWPNPASCQASINGEGVQDAINEAAAARFDEVDCSAEVEECKTVCTEPFAYCEDGESEPISCEGRVILTGGGSGEFYCEGEWSYSCGGEIYLEYCGETDEACETQTVQGNFVTFGATLEDATFSVKEMNPGPGKGKQNYEKVYAECSFP